MPVDPKQQSRWGDGWLRKAALARLVCESELSAVSRRLYRRAGVRASGLARRSSYICPRLAHRRSITNETWAGHAIARTHAAACLSVLADSKSPDLETAGCIAGARERRTERRHGWDL